MSGTSLDGVDAALVEISENQGKESVHLVDSVYQPFSEQFQSQLKSIIGCEQLSISALGELDVQLAELFAGAVQALLDKSKIPASDIEGIASHGVTLFHQPEGRFPFTWQITDPNVIAARTGCLVVADFRRMDVAFGGQGAPLVPVFHEAIAPEGKKVAIVNIGGMANVSIIRPEQSVMGFDTGPGNVLMNEWIYQSQGKAFDENGQWAGSGKIIQPLLDALMSEPYFQMPAPKSTGRELFNNQWLDEKLKRFAQGANGSSADDIMPEDVQATLLALTVETIAQSIIAEQPKLDGIYICGGGAQNSVLMQALSEKFAPVSVATTEQLGVHPDWVEAVAFAWLGYCRMEEKTLNMSKVTGVNKHTLLGGIYKPS